MKKTNTKNTKSKNTKKKKVITKVVEPKIKTNKYIVEINMFDRCGRTPKEVADKGAFAICQNIEPRKYNIISPNTMPEILHEFGHVLENIWDVSPKYKIPERLEDLGREIIREIVIDDNSHKI